MCYLLNTLANDLDFMLNDLCPPPAQNSLIRTNKLHSNAIGKDVACTEKSCLYGSECLMDSIRPAIICRGGYYIDLLG
ncbi:hypothetical protein J6590_035714 [Homalodisca vitripennis]|nr:hypothetical protein J6590_035714 [Homalodisca vitripennis]